MQAAIVEAREAERMTLEHEVRALVAVRLADLVDRASSSSDSRGFLTASSDLLEVLDTLPIRAGGAGGGGDDRGSARGRLLSIIDGPPVVGDTPSP